MSAVVQEQSTSCVYDAINYYKRIDGEGERVFELTDIRFIYSIYIFNPQNKG